MLRFWAHSSFAGLSKHNVQSWFLSNEKWSTVYLCEGALSQWTENKKLMHLIWHLSKSHLYSGKWSAVIPRTIYEVVYKMLLIVMCLVMFTLLQANGENEHDQSHHVWSQRKSELEAQLCAFGIIMKSKGKQFLSKQSINTKWILNQKIILLHLDASCRLIHLTCFLLLMQDFAHQKRFLSLV